MSKKSVYKERSREILEELSASGRRPSLLLHACCAPCSSYVLEHLQDCFRITVLFYNPNIDPPEEYERRAKELERLIARMGLSEKVSLITADFHPEEFYDAVSGLETEPEGGGRCGKCFRLRLGEAAETAKRGGFEYFTTTLTISPHKNADVINGIGEELALQYDVKWFPSDFKKDGGFLRSTELSRQYELYRQDYCGCRFSVRKPLQ